MVGVEERRVEVHVQRDEPVGREPLAVALVLGWRELKSMGHEHDGERSRGRIGGVGRLDRHGGAGGGDVVADLDALGGVGAGQIGSGRGSPSPSPPASPSPSPSPPASPSPPDDSAPEDSPPEVSSPELSPPAVSSPVLASAASGVVSSLHPNECTKSSVVKTNRRERRMAGGCHIWWAGARGLTWYRAPRGTTAPECERDDVRGGG